MTNDADERPDFGPGGYLPRRAAQRARKIILRERMGLGWPVAAVLAAVVLAVVGVVFLFTRSAAPGPPFVAVVAIEEVEAGGVTRLEPAGVPMPLLVVRVGGGVGVFEAPGEPVVYCPASRRLEAPGAVWNLRGRLVGGDGSSLRPLTSRVHAGVLYVHPHRTTAAPAPAPEGETPRCAPSGAAAGHVGCDPSVPDATPARAGRRRAAGAWCPTRRSG